MINFCTQQVYIRVLSQSDCQLYKTMIAIVLLGLLVCANAAPRHGCHHHRHHRHHGHSYYEDDSNMDDYLDSYIESQMFDTRRFWSELNRNMMRLDRMLADLSKRFPNHEYSVQIDDKEYKISLQLQGFLEKEIIVKAKKGLVVVQAIRKVVGEPDRDYFNVKTLPDNVGENGSWTYKNGLLEIIFPITVENEILTQTESPHHSREENGNNEQDKDQNKDIFEIRGDVDYTNQKDLETNQIPHQENIVNATNHAVDFNDSMKLVSIPSDY